MKDYYKILGVSRTASNEEIKRAYYRLAKVYHPDVNNGNKDVLNKFYEITEAYQTLINLERRLKYSLELRNYSSSKKNGR
ncbi:MAG: DnaJ domain-containing protein [Candidatus Kapaibacteriales bacterium]